MRRKKSIAKWRVVSAIEEDKDDVVLAVEIEMKDIEPSKIVPAASKAGNDRKKEIDREIVMSFKEDFEEVENVRMRLRLRTVKKPNFMQMQVVD
ncbi:hypothetical protein COLO4_29929 [Corchorus olitorius]|uniref:Uncharacterized protein n=1 Tax=Corchorus olitorius TaxID=93759 RepID=A0A1R3HCE9_9ROSI|nr:hypothetical protein COLO4_29929 [Corchorus olitorius]